jgi:hypothetical protein
MADNDPHKREPTQATLKEAKRLMAAAESAESRVTLREESAQFLDERGEHEQAAIERREAGIERDAARDAWDRAVALQGPTQMTQPKTGKPLEIPIPTREAFLGNLKKVAPPPVKSVEDDKPDSVGDDPLK